jgi:hypothetical protein
MTGCHQTTTASLATRLSDPTRKRLMWKWKSGDPTGVSEFGDPRSTTSAALCIYADTGSGPALVADLGVAAGSAWIARRSLGFQYRNDSGGSSGITRVKLLAKSTGAGGLLVKAAGASIPLSAGDIPDGAVVTTQWANSDGQCWESR